MLKKSSKDKLINIRNVYTRLVHYTFNFLKVFWKTFRPSHVFQIYIILFSVLILHKKKLHIL